MIIYPKKQYNPETGAEWWVNPAPFILEERDLGIVRDFKDEMSGEFIPAAETFDFMRKSAAIGRRIDRGIPYVSPEIEALSVSYTVRGEDGEIRHDLHMENVIRAANHFIGILNGLIRRYRDEAFSMRLKEGWALDCDICQGTATPYIYDPELARTAENEIERRAIKLAMEMVRNGEVR